MCSPCLFVQYSLALEEYPWTELPLLVLLPIFLTSDFTA